MELHWEFKLSGLQGAQNYFQEQQKVWFNKMLNGCLFDGYHIPITIISKELGYVPVSENTRS